jgi:hypothetical protein
MKEMGKKASWILRIIIIFLLTLLLNTSSHGAPIDLQLGCRPLGMGGAFVAIADDANALYWNPAGLAFLKRGETTFMHAFPYGVKDLGITYFGISQPFGVNAGVGVSWVRIKAKLYEGKENVSSEIAENVYSLGSGVNLKDIPVGFGFCLKRLSFSSKIGGGTGFGFDVGLLWKINQNLMAGLAIRNIATDVKGEAFRQTWRAGVGVKVPENKLIIAFDINKKVEINKKKIDYQWHFGVEKFLHPNFVSRIGINKKSLTGGFGFKIKRLQLNTAFYKDLRYPLGYTSRFSLNIYF